MYVHIFLRFISIKLKYIFLPAEEGPCEIGSMWCNFVVTSLHPPCHDHYVESWLLSSFLHWIEYCWRVLLQRRMKACIWAFSAFLYYSHFPSLLLFSREINIYTFIPSGRLLHPKIMHAMEESKERWRAHHTVQEQNKAHHFGRMKYCM